jgi:hypothetical protein
VLNEQAFMGTMRMMLETICEKQTVALRMVLDEAYKIMDKDKAREDGGAAAAAADGAAQATKDVPVAGTTANGADHPEAGQDTAAHEQEEEHELL